MLITEAKEGWNVLTGQHRNNNTLFSIATLHGTVEWNIGVPPTYPTGCKDVSLRESFLRWADIQSTISVCRVQTGYCKRIVLKSWILVSYWHPACCSPLVAPHHNSSWQINVCNMLTEWQKMRVKSTVSTPCYAGDFINTYNTFVVSNRKTCHSCHSETQLHIKNAAVVASRLFIGRKP